LLPGLADALAFLGIPFATIVVFGSGIRSPWGEINGPSILAISMVVGLWFFATIGEDFPRTACWILLVSACAILAAIVWIALVPDWTRFSNGPSWLLIAFAIYDSVAVLGAVYHLFVRDRPDPAA
jgi:hypothetical protein